MPGLHFRVEKVLPKLAQVSGVVLIGPPLNDAVLHVGDAIEVETSGGVVVGTVSVFPMIRLAPEMDGWVRVAVTGIDGDAVTIGAVARS